MGWLGILLLAPVWLAVGAIWLTWLLAVMLWMLAKQIIIVIQELAPLVKMGAIEVKPRVLAVINLIRASER